MITSATNMVAQKADVMAAVSIANVSLLVQTIAIIAAGVFGYSKYVKGRTHYASLQLDLETSIQSGDGSLFLLIQATVKNTGTYRIVFNDWSCRRLIRISSLRPQGLDQIHTMNACQWNQNAALTVYLDTVVRDGIEYPDFTFSLEPDEQTAVTASHRRFCFKRFTDRNSVRGRWS
jgi:hypothetical protein